MKKKENSPSGYKVTTVVSSMRKAIWCYENIFHWRLGDASLQGDAPSLSERKSLGKGAAGFPRQRKQQAKKSWTEGAWRFAD